MNEGQPKNKESQVSVNDAALNNLGVAIYRVSDLLSQLQGEEIGKCAEKPESILPSVEGLWKGIAERCNKMEEQIRTIEDRLREIFL